jgi:hypothetical protein
MSYRSLKCIYTVNVQVSQIRSKHSLPVANGSRAGWRWAPERDESFSQAGHLSEHFSASGPRCVPFVRRRSSQFIISIRRYLFRTVESAASRALDT